MEGEVAWGFLSGRNRAPLDSKEELETDPKTEEVTEENDNELNKGILNEFAKSNNSFEHTHKFLHIAHEIPPSISVRSHK